MSDTIDWVVDMDATLEEACKLSGKIKYWLMEEEIILPEPSGMISYGGENIYLPGLKAEKWSKTLCREVNLCGVEFVTEHAVFHAGDSGLEGFECPNCRQRYEEAALPWTQAVGEWWEESGNAFMGCPICCKESSIIEWRFLPYEWGFGNLGFGFNNWTIDIALAEAIERLLGHSCRIIHQNI